MRGDGAAIVGRRGGCQELVGVAVLLEFDGFTGVVIFNKTVRGFAAGSHDIEHGLNIVFVAPSAGDEEVVFLHGFTIANAGVSGCF